MREALTDLLSCQGGKNKIAQVFNDDILAVLSVNYFMA
jgi:hypothetical protein